MVSVVLNYECSFQAYYLPNNLRTMDSPLIYFPDQDTIKKKKLIY
jgi:hypothetical protein